MSTMRLARPGDLPGLIAFASPGPLWLAGEGTNPEAAGAPIREVLPYTGKAENKQSSAVEWLLKD